MALSSGNRDHQFDVRLTLFGIKLFDDIVTIAPADALRVVSPSVPLRPWRFENAVDKVQLIFGIQRIRPRKSWTCSFRFRSYSAVSDS